ncbi:MAG: hypothetical protein L0Z50_41160 [Verrucomicrobiales bacterium]|nr:hypothetical protein [Verrucomicrobiales bacterium]
MSAMHPAPEPLPEYFQGRRGQPVLAVIFFALGYGAWLFLAGCSQNSGLALLGEPNVFDAIFFAISFLLLKILPFKWLKRGAKGPFIIW